MKFTESVYKTIGHYMLKGYPVTDSEEVGTLKSGKKHLIYIPQEGEKVYGKIPNEISDKLIPERKNAENNVPSPQTIIKQEDCIIIPLSYTHGVFGDSAKETDFLVKIKFGEMTFAYLGEQSHSNVKPQILNVIGNKIIYDSSNANLFEKEFECGKKSIQNNSTQIENTTEQRYNSKKVMQDYKKAMEASQEDSFENNIKKFENHIHSREIKFIK